ncbi:hypothetical protein BN946_scf184943.g34 [Trametes cinnabarina]|uniref:Uncharacterized protein n=1 Tax=Pycnoporus cinnabarinus TaxID=5643 RepID=A0A060SIE5_PYCCI|nr:hypothetical protein BN946_scf184943.g34 [Trametes cinnabarina]
MSFLHDWLTSTLGRLDSDQTTSPRHINHVKRDRERRRRCGNCETLNTLLHAAKQDLDTAQKHLQDSQRTVREQQNALNESASAQRTLEERSQQLEGHAAGLKKRVAQLEGDLNNLNKAKDEVDRALTRAENERRDLTALLETRTAELKEAQTYLSKVDDISDSEVLQLVEKINSQIYQAASKIASDLQSSYGLQKKKSIREEAAVRLEQSTLLGPDLPRLLAVHNHQHDSVLVQIALQTLFATLLCHFASPWFDGANEHAPFLRSIYAEMCKHESQSVFGRWRTMTLTYMQGLLPEDTRSASSAAQWQAEFVNQLLVAAGANDDVKFVSKHYGKGLKALTAHALEFRHIAGVRVVSGDFNTTVVGPNQPFSSEQMVDEWANPKDANARAPSDARVFSTTHLGLIRTERQAGGGKKVQDSGAVRQLVLLKPKVVLHHTIQELLEDFVQGGAATEEHPVTSGP